VAGSVRAAWKARRGARPTPVLMVVRYHDGVEERTALCGAADGDPLVYVDMDADQAARFCETALVARQATIAGDPQSALLGPLTTIDTGKVDELLAARADTIRWAAVFMLGAALSLASLLRLAPLPENDPITLTAIVCGAALTAWIIGELTNRFWIRMRSDWWRAHVWLLWLESAVPDPLAMHGKIVDEPILAMMSCPHPALAARLNGAEWAPLNNMQARRDAEAWLRTFAARWKYRFANSEWERWRHDASLSFTA